MRPFLEKKIAAKVAPVLGQPLTQSGTLPSVAPELTNEGLLLRYQQMVADFSAFTEQATTIMSRQQTTITTQSGLLQQMAVAMEQVTLRLQSIAGNEAVAATMQQLYQTMQQNLADDKLTAADVLKDRQALQQIQQQLPGFALATDLAAGLLGKANATTVQGLSTRVGTVESKLPELATTSALTTATSTVQSAVDAQKTRVDGVINTTLPALQTAVDSKLNRAGDTATGQIKVPVADATTLGKTAAPRFEQVIGGINQPVRIAQNVGATSVALDSYTDGTGLSRSLYVRNINFLAVTAPAANLLGNVTLKVGTTPGGTQIYSEVISTSLLAGLLGKLNSPKPPTNAVKLAAGAVVYVTVTPSAGSDAGSWVAIVDAVFIPNAS